LLVSDAQLLVSDAQLLVSDAQSFVSDAHLLGSDAHLLVSDAESLGVRNQRLVVISFQRPFTSRNRQFAAVSDRLLLK
jgi:hypothetical protein